MTPGKMGLRVIFGLCLLLVVSAQASGTTPQILASSRDVSANGAAPDAPNRAVVSCPFSATGGDDRLWRSFCIQPYPATTLGRVRLFYTTNLTGTCSVALTARADSYDGPLIGTAPPVTLELPAGGYVAGTFDFGDAPVVAGSTVAFTQEQIGGEDPVYYNAGPCGYDLDCTMCPGVYQTGTSDPPLGSIRRRSVAVIVEDATTGRLYLPLVAG